MFRDAWARTGLVNAVRRQHEMLDNRFISYQPDNRPITKVLDSVLNPLPLIGLKVQRDICAPKGAGICDIKLAHRFQAKRHSKSSDVAAS